MTIPNEAERVAKLIRLRDDARREADESAGALKQVMDRLQREHGCASLEEADNMINTLSKEISKDEKELEALLKDLEKQYGDRL